MRILLHNKDTKNKTVIILYTLMFFFTWTIYVFTLSKYFYNVNNTAIPIMKQCIKVLIWTCPVLLMLKYFYNQSPIEYLKIKGNLKDGIKWGIAVSCIIVIYIFLRNYFTFGIVFNLNLDLNTLLGSVLMVGFTEEIVFRGYLLQKFDELYGFKIAAIISTILFTLIHFPGWISHNKFFLLETVGNVMYVFIFGFIQAYVLRRSKSMWACIIIHSLNNLAVALFTKFDV